jgi:hypothetical protein
MVDTNRRSIPTRPIGRVLSGQDRYEKEALEGDPVAAQLRRERLASAAPPREGQGSFAERLQQKAGKPR